MNNTTITSSIKSTMIDSITLHLPGQELLHRISAPDISNHVFIFREQMIPYSNICEVLYVKYDEYRSIFC